jgi:hypothetical protein
VISEEGELKNEERCGGEEKKSMIVKNNMKRTVELWSRLLKRSG